MDFSGWAAASIRERIPANRRSYTGDVNAQRVPRSVVAAVILARIRSNVSKTSGSNYLG
jgi:hypothetical protein